MKGQSFKLATFFLPLILTTFLTGIYQKSWAQCQTLVWEDEFLGNAVDLSKWSFDIGDGCPSLCGWGNAEEQYYRAENASVANGVLTITTNRQDFGGKPYTSAKITTQGKHNFRFGRMEASIKLPSAGGIWPAFWLLPENGSWPYTGEIDVMESQHSNPSSIGGTVHYFNNGHSFNPREYHAGLDLSQGFHQYAIEWEPGEIRWYVDNVLFHTVTPVNTVDPWPFDAGDWFLILNVAVGGPGTPYTGFIPPTPGDYPTQMEVDYVRVYNGTFNISLSGDQTVYEGDQAVPYGITPVTGATYNWSVPAGATLVSGQGTPNITVDWGNTGGEVSVDLTSGCGTQNYQMTVTVSPPPLVDYVFEDFESNRNLTYGLASGTLTQGVANPAPSAANNSTLTGQYIRNASEQYDILLMESSQIGNALEYVSGKKLLWLDVYTDAPVGTEILLQLEDGTQTGNPYPAGRHSRYAARTSTQNTWHRLEFELLDRPDLGVGAFDVNQLAMLIEPNSNTNHTLYVDNLVGMRPPAPVIQEEVMLADYDGINHLTPIFVNGVYAADTANPDPTGSNTSAQVAYYARNAAEQYDVVSFGTSSITDAKPFKDGDQVFTMDVYTSAAVGTEILISLENAALSEGDYPAGRNSQYTGVVEQSDTWHSVSFVHVGSPDGGTSNVSIDEISLLFNPNSNTSDVYYFDNFRYGIINYPPTFVDGTLFQDYESPQQLPFVSGSGVHAAPVANPNPAGINSSSQVAQYTRNTTEQYDVLFLDATAITDASQYANEEKRFALDMYTSAPVGTVISWQLESSTMATSSNYPVGRHSIYQSVVQAQNSWHTLEFTLTATPDLFVTDNDVDRVVFLFDPNSSGGDTYYIDNLRSRTKQQAPVLTSITVTPANITIDEGQTQQFAAQAIDQNGQPMTVPITWSVDVGSIDAQGLYTGSTSGTFAVTATSGTVSGTASITVNPVITTSLTFPGIIQAEDYDEGGQGAGYNDNSPGNTGNSYRTDDVDIEATADQGGGFNVGWITTGEWLKYTFNVTQGGDYQLDLRVASPQANASFYVEIDGANVSGTVSVPTTGGWQAWQTIAVNDIALSQGVHALYVRIVSGGFNLNYIEGTIQGTSPTPMIQLPGRLEMEDYDQGGEGVGYHELNPGNSGTAYRTDDVDIEATGDVGGGYNVGWVLAGEWLRYTIDVTQGGTFQLDYRVASAGSSGRFYVEIDGIDVSGNINVPYTGGWQAWTTLTTTGVSLTAGVHTVYVRMTGSDFNFNYIDVTVESGGNNGGMTCTQTGPNSDYTVEISDDTSNPTLTFIPGSGGGLGTPTCLLYYGTSPTGPYPGHNVTPQAPYQLTAGAGETVYFYYTYSVGGGAERNSSTHGHSFIVGSCGGSRQAPPTSWKIYPNPAQHRLTISHATNIQRVEIVSIEGKRMQTFEFSSPQEVQKLDVSQLASGPYVLRIEDTAGVWQHEMLMIRK
ncbi:MAG: carbohydrate-binding protein [Bacteroidota bacterium]